MLRKLKDFLVWNMFNVQPKSVQNSKNEKSNSGYDMRAQQYLENKNLIKDKIQDTERLHSLVHQFFSNEHKSGKFYDSRRRSNPINSSYHGKKALSNPKSGKSPDDNSHINFSKLQYDKISVERKSKFPSKISSQRKRSAGLKNTSLNKSDKSENTSKLRVDNHRNVFAQSRKILTNASNASNASQKMPKNGLLVINSNRGSINAYQDNEYSAKKKEAWTLEPNKDSSVRINYFGNRNMRKADIGNKVSSTTHYLTSNLNCYV